VIGAHFDHLGLGYDKNSLDIEPQDKIHNGADDNASGVAGVIELARYFSNNGVKEKVNFLFMTFSGEELGLIGSKKWCEQPTIPLEKISYMINMDMIGRLNDTSRKLLVYGVGTAAEFIPSLEQVNQNFVFKFDSAGVGPSDQTSFYLKDIPVLHFFTGQHSDYHKPTDDADKINHKGEAMILELIVDMVFKLEHSTKLKFYTTKSPESSNVSFKVTLGIMPDYTFDGPGVRVDGVGENKPAAIAGLQKGDVILTMANEELADVKAYMKVLSKFSKGQETEIVIDRNGQRMRKMVRFK
jgi:Zn-dependent M28 family amino/carboxypeptidase